MKTNFNIDDYQYIDFHTHMHDEAFDIDSEKVMENIIAKKILCLTIGTDIAESRKAKALSDKYSKLGKKSSFGNIFYTIGVHPHDEISATFDKNNEKDFEELLSDYCAAIGECGLDYYYLKTDKKKGLIENIDREVNKQRDIFINQINFAVKHNLPLMIHGRCSEKDETDNPNGMDAYDDIIFILEKFYTKEIGKEKYEKEDSYEENKNVNKRNHKINGNIHFFTGNIDIAQKFMDLGFTFSFGGVLTLTNDYDDVVRYIPLEYMHSETDSPYVNPKDKNGNKIENKSLLSLESLKEKLKENNLENNLSEKQIKDLNKKNKYRNNSENIDVIVAKIAEIKSLDVEFVKQQLKENFLRFLKRD